MNRRRLQILLATVIVVLLSVGATFTMAGVFLNTELVSGKLSGVSENSIELNGTTYYSAPTISDFTYSIGDTVTIRYYVNPEQENVFVEIQKGTTSLDKKLPPEPVKRHNQ